MENSEGSSSSFEFPAMSSGREAVAIGQHAFAVERMNEVPVGKMDAYRRCGQELLEISGSKLLLP